MSNFDLIWFVPNSHKMIILGWSFLSTDAPIKRSIGRMTNHYVASTSIIQALYTSLVQIFVGTIRNNKLSKWICFCRYLYYKGYGVFEKFVGDMFSNRRKARSEGLDRISYFDTFQMQQCFWLWHCQLASYLLVRESYKEKPELYTN